MPNNELKGMIRLYIGPMFSGKTSSLLEAYTRHGIGQRKCLLVKHSRDFRYDPKDVVTHDGRRIYSSAICELLCDIDNIVNGYDVICIDEIQFFEDAPIFCDKWANHGLIVEAAGLCGTYLRAEFPVISQLIPLAEEVYKKSAVCRETGCDAQFTYRTTNDTEEIVIGGSDMYKPVDRLTYFGGIDTTAFKNYETDAFRKFVNIYCKKRYIHIDDTFLNNIVSIFVQQKEKDKCYIDILKKYLDKTK